MSSFYSVDNVAKDLQRLDISRNIISVTRDVNGNVIPICIVLLDGPDFRQTVSVVETAGDLWNSDLQANLFYFQKDSRHFNEQLRNMRALPRHDPSYMRNQIWKARIEDGMQYLPTKPIALISLDTMSFTNKALDTLKEVLRHKLKRDRTDVVISFVDIVKASKRKLSMFEALSRERNDCFSSTIDSLRRARDSTNEQLFAELKGRLRNIIAKFGFEFRPLDNLIIDPQWTLNDKYTGRLFSDGDIFSVLYGEDVDESGNESTVMRYTSFSLRPTDVAPIELQRIQSTIDIDVARDISMVNLIDYDDEELQDTDLENIYDYVNDVLKEDPQNKLVLHSVEGYDDPHEVIKVLVNLCLPQTDRRKAIKYLLISAPERSGKTIWEYIIGLIIHSPPFKKYLHEGGSDWEIALHISCAPYVRVPEIDQKMKSESFVKKYVEHKCGRNFRPFKEIRGKTTFQNLDSYDLDTYVSGQSSTRACVSKQICEKRYEHRTQTVVFFDESDRQFTGSGSQTENDLLSLYHYQGVCGVILCSASLYPNLRTDDQKILPLDEQIKVFRLRKPPGYNGIETYQNIFPIDNEERFSIEADNNITANVQDYLSVDLHDDTLINRHQKVRGFPLALVMTTSSIASPSIGLKKQAMDLSAGRYRHIRYPFGRPICLCVRAGGFNVYVDGKDESAKFDKVGRVNLQTLIPQCLREYRYGRHLVIFGFNMMQRGVTSQFTDEYLDFDFEDDQNSWLYLGFIRNLVCCFKYDKKRTLTRSNEDVTQMVMRAAMRTGGIDVPFFDNFKVFCSAPTTLIDDIIHHKVTEGKVLTALHFEGTLRKAWNSIREEPLSVSMSFNKFGGGSKKSTLTGYYDKINQPFEIIQNDAARIGTRADRSRGGVVSQNDAVLQIFKENPSILLNAESILGELRRLNRFKLKGQGGASSNEFTFVTEEHSNESAYLKRVQRCFNSLEGKGLLRKVGDQHCLGVLATE